MKLKPVRKTLDSSRFSNRDDAVIMRVDRACGLITSSVAASAGPKGRRWTFPAQPRELGYDLALAWPDCRESLHDDLGVQGRL